MSSIIFMPEYMYYVDMIDKGSSKINRYEIFTKLYHFAEENFLGPKFEIVQAEAGTEYRLEKAGDKIFIVGRRCREHGTGVEGNYKKWYSLSENGKKLIMGFPSLYFNQPGLGPWGYELTAGNVQFNAGGDMSVTVDYNVRKYYELNIDIANEFGHVNVKGRKKVIFKWDEEKEVFISEYLQN